MKKAILVFSLLIPSAAFANPKLAQKAIESFNASPLVKAEFVRLEAKKLGAPIAIEVAGMGDGCEYMGSFLIVQKVKGNSFAEKTVTARVSVSEIFHKDCGENKPNEIVATFGHVVDLNQATQ